MIITWEIETLVMGCLCLFIHLTIWSKNLSHIWWSLSEHSRHSRTYSVRCFLNYRMLLYLRNYAAGIHRNCHKSSDCFAEYPKKSLLKSSYPKKYMPKFSFPKRSWNQEFKPQKILWSSLSLKIWGTPPRPGVTSSTITNESSPGYVNNKQCNTRASSHEPGRLGWPVY